MDNASDYESGDCRFESCHGRKFFFSFDGHFWSNKAANEAEGYEAIEADLTKTRYMMMIMINFNFLALNLWEELMDIQINIFREIEI